MRFNCLLFIVVFLSSCTKDIGQKPITSESNNYPTAVANILMSKCATSGCHNAASKDAAAGLNLSTWETLFEGARDGAVVIPFRPDFSMLMFYTNSYTEFGTIQLEPKMPINQPALSKDEIKVLYDWIKKGAPNADGLVKFSDDPSRQKVYAANQGCDVVTVFDSKSMLAMRYVDVGETRGIEAPHMIKVSPDNLHWYVSFIGGGFFSKYKTSDNAQAGKVNLGMGSWNTFVITADSKTAYAVDWSSPGKIAIIDLVNMTSKVYTGFHFPHGSALSKHDDFLYVTAQNSNYLYKFDLKNFGEPKIIILDESGLQQDFGALKPHEVIFSPDGSKYFVSCQGTNEVRVLETATDKLVATIKTGEFPQEMSICKNKPYLFVSCMEDTTSNAIQLSSIDIINYQSMTKVKSVYAGYQSHGLAVDEKFNRVYVGNRNILSSGPTPHHYGSCSGRNGYITAIDLNTLELVPKFNPEVSIDPYGLGITHQY